MNIPSPMNETAHKLGDYLRKWRKKFGMITEVPLPIPRPEDIPEGATFGSEDSAFSEQSQKREGIQVKQNKIENGGTYVEG